MRVVMIIKSLRGGDAGGDDHKILGEVVMIIKSQEMPPDAITEITKSQEMHQVVM
jgi:hypothetical protein